MIKFNKENNQSSMEKLGGIKSGKYEDHIPFTDNFY